ncbi:MAG: BON domain-containing protein [Isosphaeraceae bacterium]
MRRPPLSTAVPNADSTPPPNDFAQRLERHIERSACGRISDLHVDCVDGNVVLRGRCRTYHAKQLVLQAALEMADGVLGLGLVNQIVVR